MPYSYVPGLAAMQTNADLARGNIATIGQINIFLEHYEQKNYMSAGFVATGSRSLNGSEDRWTLTSWSNFLS